MLDWIAAAFELTGSWLVGNKRKIGFIITLIGCLCWIYIALTVPKARGLLLVVVPAIFVNIRNFRKWWKAEKMYEDVITPGKQVTGETICPFCASKKTADDGGSSVDLTEGLVTQPKMCLLCGKRWNMVYNMKAKTVDIVKGKSEYL